MKTVVMALFLLFGLTAMGQHEHRGPRHEKEVSLTPEQRAVLHTKQLTLALDLDEKQQKKIQEIFLTKEEARAERIAARKESDSREKDPEKRYERMNARLDEKIAHKKEMKEILTEEQFVKWEKLAQKKGRDARHRKGHKSRSHSRKG